MMNKGVAIRYGDVAPEAKENFVPTASESEFDTLSQLQQYNLNFLNYANPCELYQTVLDGTATAFPSMPQMADIGLWSEQISNDDGTFTEPIVLELESAGQYSSQGLTLTFDTNNEIFATRLNIKWLRTTNEGITTLAEQEFVPDNAFYFCRNRIENYNKVVITFYSINMPKNRLKLRAIDYGYGTFFYGDELRNVKLIQEIDPISTQISINTADFTLDSKSNKEYSFQAKQPLSVYFNGELRATTFVKSAKRKSKYLWQIKSEDYISIMNDAQFYGGIYSNKSAVELLEEIFDTAKVPFEISEDFSNSYVTGYIPFTTCRDALMQVAFAIQAVVDTSDSNVVKVFLLQETETQTIPLKRILQGQNLVDEETVTGVEVAAHSYSISSESVELYNADDDGIGQGIFVKFSEPLHDLSITNGDIVSQGTNYAIINANDGSLLTGKRYKHATKIYQRKNPIVLASELGKIVAIENATLVSASNIDNVLEKCYNWLIRNNSVNLKIVEGKHIERGGIIKYGSAKYGSFKYMQKTPSTVTYDMPVRIGDNIRVATEYSGEKQGLVISQSFGLNGNTIVKETTMR